MRNKSRLKRARRARGKGRPPTETFETFSRKINKLFSTQRAKYKAFRLARAANVPLSTPALKALFRVGKISKNHAETVAMFARGEILKWPGRPKGTLQRETLARIEVAAACVASRYSHREMIPFLYPNNDDPEEGRKNVQKFLKRKKAAIADAVKAMAPEQAQQKIMKSLLAKSLPRDTN